MKKTVCVLMIVCMIIGMSACAETVVDNEFPAPVETENTTDTFIETEATNTMESEPTNLDVVGKPVDETTEPNDNPVEVTTEPTQEENTSPTQPNKPNKSDTPSSNETKPKEDNETTLPKNEEATPPETTTAPTEHQHKLTTIVVDPTCKDGGYTVESCECGYSDTFNFIPAIEHTFGEWTTVVEPTTTTNGQKARTCSACNHQEVDGIEKLSICETHTWVITEKETVDAYGLRHYGYVTTACSVCGEKKGTDARYFKPDNINYSAEISTIISLVNSMRASEGLSQLTTSGDWDGWAATRAQEISIVYSHNRPNGASWGRNDGVNMAFGENIAKNANSASEFYYNFLNSPQHSGLMRMPDATGIAVSFYVTEDGDSYCAMVIYGPIGM